MRRSNGFPALYSCCRHTSEPSIRTAVFIGMRFASQYPDEANRTAHVSVISRENWQKGTTDL